VNAPVPPPPRRDHTVEVAIVSAAAVFIALVIYAPQFAFLAFLLLLFALS
jgi:hypothetical protein